MNSAINKQVNKLSTEKDKTTKIISFFSQNILSPFQVKISI